MGKSRDVIQDSDLRGRVERVLAELCMTTLPVDNLGMFVVDTQSDGGSRRAAISTQ